MDKFEKVTDVLLSYARGIAPDMLPQVQFKFKHSPSDIPVEDTWNLVVDLLAFEKVTQGGVSSSPGFKSQWTSSGLNREVCLDGIIKQLSDFFTDALAKKMDEQASLETAMNLLSAESTVGEIWRDDPRQIALAEEAEEAAEAAANSPLIILSKG